MLKEQNHVRVLPSTSQLQMFGIERMKRMIKWPKDFEEKHPLVYWGIVSVVVLSAIAFTFGFIVPYVTDCLIGFSFPEAFTVQNTLNVSYTHPCFKFTNITVPVS